MRVEQPPTGSGRGPLRTLRVAVGVAAVIVVVALVALWPTGDRSLRIGPNGIPTQRATLTDVGGTCVAIPEPPCQRLFARLDNGPDAGTTTAFDVTDDLAFSVGDRVRLFPTGAPADAVGPTGAPADRYAFSDFERRSQILWLALAFAVVIVATTRWRGLRALAALGVSLTLLVLFVVPAIARGSDPLLIALVGSMAIVLATIPLAYGLGVKALAAMVGTTSSLLVTLLLARLATSFTGLTGRASEEVLLLQAFNRDQGISIIGLLIAGMVIGALGVLDDLTVTQASTVLALRRANPALRFGELFRGALSVGNDHILATVNTLVLAYAGAALPTLLVFSAADTGFWDAFNSEVVAADVVSMLVGSIGLVAAVPVTTALAAALAARMDATTLPAAPDHAH